MNNNQIYNKINKILKIYNHNVYLIEVILMVPLILFMIYLKYYLDKEVMLLQYYHRIQRTILKYRLQLDIYNSNKNIWHMNLKMK